MKGLLRDIEGFIAIIGILLIVWTSASWADVMWSNRDPFADHNPHSWNAFVILTEVADGR